MKHQSPRRTQEPAKSAEARGQGAPFQGVTMKTRNAKPHQPASPNPTTSVLERPSVRPPAPAVDRLPGIDVKGAGRPSTNPQKDSSFGATVSSWDRSRKQTLTRGGEKLDPGVNFFVEALERLGATTSYSCEGHPKGFYVAFQATYDLAVAIARSGFFNVEVGKGEGEFTIRLGSNEAGFAATFGKPWNEREKRQCLRHAAEAWDRNLLQGVPARPSWHQPTSGEARSNVQPPPKVAAVEAKASRAMTGLEAVTLVKQALADAGMPRTSRMNGGELTGWTTNCGSTGFSIREAEGGDLLWHIVLSGKPLLDYRHTEDGHQPIRPEVLFSRLHHVFTSLGLAVLDVRLSGYQEMWDDDVEYTVVTKRPDWLQGKAEPRESARL